MLGVFAAADDFCPDEGLRIAYRLRGGHKPGGHTRGEGEDAVRNGKTQPQQPGPLASWRRRADTRGLLLRLESDAGKREAPADPL